MLSRIGPALGAALFLMVALPSTGLAHAFPDHAVPAVGSRVATAPDAVRIWFTEALEPAFSTMTVLNAQGDDVDRGDARVDARDPTLLSVSLKPLPPGTYKVVWRAVSRDTHRTEGDFTFTVAR
jgi:copper resistance protein C